jgi:beta-1,4-mannosyl-glycoprotein beta-1,4-N-acetylglucosaminyltransferase
MPKIYDCFTFFNEFRLLELRLKLHWDSVDRFVIAEATSTFQGKPKPLNLLEARDRFAPFWSKIEYVIVDDMPNTYNSWDREFHQRNALGRGLKSIANDDIVLLSDVDELIRPEVLSELKKQKLEPRDILCFELDWYVYYLNVKYNKKWLRQSPRAILYGSMMSLQSLRIVGGPTKPFVRDAVRAFKTAKSFRKFMNRKLVHNAGWHFTWLGGATAVTEKAKSISSHSGMAKNEELLTKQTLEGLRVAQQEQGGFSVVEFDASYPNVILDNLLEWEDMIFRKNAIADEQ